MIQYLRSHPLVVIVCVWSLILIGIALFDHFDTSKSMEATTLLVLIISGAPWIFFLLGTHSRLSEPGDEKQKNGAAFDVQVQKAVDNYISKFSRVIGWTGLTAVLAGIFYVSFHLPKEAIAVAQEEIRAVIDEDVMGLRKHRIELEKERAILESSLQSTQGKVGDLDEKADGLNETIKRIIAASKSADLLANLANHLANLDKKTNGKDSKAKELVSKLDELLTSYSTAKDQVETTKNIVKRLADSTFTLTAKTGHLVRSVQFSPNPDVNIPNLKDDFPKLYKKLEQIKNDAARLP